MVIDLEPTPDVTENDVGDTVQLYISGDKATDIQVIKQPDGKYLIKAQKDTGR